MYANLKVEVRSKDGVLTQEYEAWDVMFDGQTGDVTIKLDLNSADDDYNQGDYAVPGEEIVVPAGTVGNISVNADY